MKMQPNTLELFNLNVYSISLQQHINLNAWYLQSLKSIARTCK